MYLTELRKILSRSVDSRAWLVLGAALLATILVTSFGAAGYVYYQWARERTRQSASSASVDVSPELLLRRADGLLAKRETEQALLAYRRVLGHDPRLLSAQLGGARD